MTRTAIAIARRSAARADVSRSCWRFCPRAARSTSRQCKGHVSSSMPSKRPPAEAGELIRPLARGLIARTDILGDLCDLVTGASAGRQTPDEITLFKSAGTAVEDFAAAKLICSGRRSQKRTADIRSCSGAPVGDEHTATPRGSLSRRRCCPPFSKERDQLCAKTLAAVSAASTCNDTMTSTGTGRSFTLAVARRNSASSQPRAACATSTLPIADA